MAALTTALAACSGASDMDLFGSPSGTGNGPCSGPTCEPKDAAATAQGSGGSTSTGVGGSPQSGGAGGNSTGIGQGTGGAITTGAAGSGPTGGAGMNGGGGAGGPADLPDATTPGIESGTIGDAGARDVAVERVPDVAVVRDACVSSGAEICDGLDNNCNGTIDERACADGCIGAQRNGVGYMFCFGAAQWRTWDASQTQCANRGMNLAQIDDAAQNAWIHNLADGVNYVGTIWLGGEDPDDTGAWFWIGGAEFWIGGRTGRAVGGRYTNWDVGQPPNVAFQQDCLVMSGVSDVWRANQCGVRTAFICQNPP